MTEVYYPQVWAAEALRVLRSNVVTVYTSDHARYRAKALGDDRYSRLVDHVVEHPVTADQLDAFAEAEKAWALLEASPYFELDGFDACPTLTHPTPRREYVYAETEAEWLERCRALDATGF